MAKTTTKTEIANRSLRMIGEASAVMLTDVETDTGDVADIVRQFLEYTIRKVQANYRWEELIKRVELPTPADDLTEDPLYDWGYRYDLPTDYIQPVWTDETDYEIEGNYIYCNCSENYPFNYYAYSEDPTTWNPQLLIAVTHELAMSICIPITENEKKYEKLLQEYEQVILPRIERTSAYAKVQPNSRYKRQNWSKERGAAYYRQRATRRRLF